MFLCEWVSVHVYVSKYMYSKYIIIYWIVNALECSNRVKSIRWMAKAVMRNWNSSSRLVKSLIWKYLMLVLLWIRYKRFINPDINVFQSTDWNKICWVTPISRIGFLHFYSLFIGWWTKSNDNKYFNTIWSMINCMKDATSQSFSSIQYTE